MRRSVAAIAGTIIGTTLIIGAKLGHPVAEADAAYDPAADGVPVDEAAGAGDGGGVVDPSAVATPTGKPTKGAAPTPGTTTQASPKPTATTGTSPKPPSPKPTTTTGTGTGLKDGTYTGPGVQGFKSTTTKYGTITVTIVVSGGKITKASATCTADCGGDNADYADKAISGLNPKVVTAQSASISGVSGATYSSNAYKKSLAAAILKAKA